MKNKLEFLNQNGGKFDWENDDLAEIKVKTREEKLVQPNFIAEIPGIPLESDYVEIQPPQISRCRQYREQRQRVKMLVMICK